jgi:hypothetical protein
MRCFAFCRVVILTFLHILISTSSPVRLLPPVVHVAEYGPSPYPYRAADRPVTAILRARRHKKRPRPQPRARGC